MGARTFGPVERLISAAIERKEVLRWEKRSCAAQRRAVRPLSDRGVSISLMLVLRADFEDLPHSDRDPTSVIVEPIAVFIRLRGIRPNDHGEALCSVLGVVHSKATLRQNRSPPAIGAVDATRS